MDDRQLFQDKLRTIMKKTEADYPPKTPYDIPYVVDDETVWSPVPARPVVCVETNECFSSAEDASKSLEIGAAHIRGAIRNGKRAGGFHWRYARLDPAGLPSALLAPEKPLAYNGGRTKTIGPRTFKKGRGILCLETGVIYSGVNQVLSEYPSISQSRLYVSLAEGKPIAKREHPPGLTFEWVSD